MHQHLPISSVARETGINKETLRKWETRYGFPMPLRGVRGERSYSPEQVAKLVAIKRRIDTGQRPSSVIQALNSPAPETLRTVDEATRACVNKVVEEALVALKSHDLDTFRRILERNLTSHGLRPFVENTLTALTWSVGEAWSHGTIRVFEEHIFSEILQDLLAQRSRCLITATGSPRVLLTTLPGEWHALGLAMVKACFTEAGAYCLSLGTPAPQSEIVEAAMAFDIDLVAVSISAAYPKRLVRPALKQLRLALPGKIVLWAGGQGVQHISRPPDGVVLFSDIGQALDVLARLDDGRDVHGVTGQSNHV